MSTQAKVRDRVRFIHSDDPYTKLEPGVLGTVRFIDGFGTVHVNWDDGSTLGMIERGGDRYEVIEEA